MRPIFVTGVTGRHGATGAALARLLRQDGIPVRAFTRGSADANDVDVEWVTGDLHDRRSLVAPLEGVDVAYFTYPVAPGIVDAAANFAAAAQEAGVRRVVVMSMAVSNPDSPSPLGRAQWLAEEILEWAGLSPIKLRVAAFFYENLELLHGAEIRSESVIRNSFSGSAVSWMSGRDAAMLAKVALLHPERFAEAAVYPTGSEAISHDAIAALLSEHVGRVIRHETIAPKEWEAHLAGLSRNDARINTAMAEHISILGGIVRQDQQPTGLYDELVERRTTSFSDVLAQGEIQFT
jgi:uncharacterized protein YbjT (DUF2867 family)